MKKIAITQRLCENESYKETRECLDINWGELFLELGFAPIVLPIKYDVKKIYDEVGFDGIILSGGNDLYSLNENELSKQRDEFEMNLIKFALEKDIPLLGVCRGMQIVAQFFDCSFKKIPNQISTRDKLTISKNSKYYNALCNIKSVNSYASFFIDKFSKELIASATNQDGIIKAIEHIDKKIFGIMWHSEREKPFDKQQNLLIKQFFG